MLLNAGAELLVLTRMANVLVALFAGTPLSVTTVVRILVWPSCADVGVQVMTPFALIVTRLVPTSGFVTEEVKVCAGISQSFAALVNTNGVDGAAFNMAGVFRKNGAVLVGEFNNSKR